MKKKLLLLSFYLIGCFFGYIYTKKTLQESLKSNEWTKEDKAFSILLSSGSWFTLASMGYIHLLNNISNNNDILEY